MPDKIEDNSINSFFQDVFRETFTYEFKEYDFAILNS